MPKLLIVEDDPALLDAYKILFTKEGFEVLTAINGDIGLKTAASEKPDAILLDLLMPFVDGMEFLRRFKPKKHPETKVIVSTNVSVQSPGGVKEAMELGAKGYIVKASNSPKELVKAVRDILTS